MIELLIFHLHIFWALYAFTKNWQKRGLKEAVLAVAVIALIFSVGWALTNPIAGLIWNGAWDSIWFTHDTMSLTLLIIPESIFFYMFFVRDRA